MQKNGNIRKRNRELTEQQILQAAMVEFLEHGRAGARIDRIADSAGVNKANIYHYFGSKDDLLNALLSEQLTVVRKVREDQPASFPERLAYFQAQQLDDKAWIRLVTWEALEYQTGKEIIAEQERTIAWRTVIKGLEAAMKNGELPKLDAKQLQLSLVAMVTFPIAFPQFTKMITGLEWNSAEFKRQRTRFLVKFARAFTAA